MTATVPAEDRSAHRPSAEPSANGALLALTAYCVWGLSPLFWKQLSDVPAAATVAWRVVATLALLLMILSVRGNLGALRAIVVDRRARLATTLSALAIATNWVVYMWAVNSDRVSEASLGYFVYPLVSVVLGVVVLSERLRRAQWWAVALAAVGVVWLTLHEGAVPWVPMTLAVSFGIYGLIRKVAPVDPFAGLAFETAVIFLPCAILLGTWDGGDNLTWGAGTMVLLILSGGFTALPLVLFAAAVPRVPLSVIGLLQYVNPFLQLFLGVVVYDEDFGQLKLVGYVIIWVALAVFMVDSLRANRRPFRAG